MLTRHTSPAGITLIKSFEGICDGDPTTVNLDPYLDPLKIWSIGWGHAIRYQGDFVRGEIHRALARSLFPNGLTINQCESLLINDLGPVEIYLGGVFPALNQNQFDALASFCFNAGLGNFETSTMFAMLKRGAFEIVADEFLRWNKGHDDHGKLVVLDGLTKRRAAERALFLTEVSA